MSAEELHGGQLAGQLRAEFCGRRPPGLLLPFPTHHPLKLVPFSFYMATMIDQAKLDRFCRVEIIKFV
jgi:hypothetical protein